MLIDTHVLGWALYEPRRLSGVARRNLEEGDRLILSPISHYEIVQKVRRGRWPKMARFARDPMGYLERVRVFETELTLEICDIAGHLD